MHWNDKERLSMIRSLVRQVVQKYSTSYWIECDEKREYPTRFVNELASLGLFGVNIPAEYGGSGGSIEDADAVLSEISNSEAGPGIAQSLHAVFFNNHILSRYGTEEAKKKYLPEIASGKLRFQVFAITEPDAGFNTSNIKTRAVRRGDRYVINGQKTFISRVMNSDIGILACKTEQDKISLFLVDLSNSRDSIEVHEIKNNSRRAIDTCHVFINDLEVPSTNLIGEEGNGMKYLLEGANAERILMSGQMISGGRYVVRKAVEYANQRVVFKEPIGKYQAIQFPLSDAWIRLEAAERVKNEAVYHFEQDSSSKLTGYYSNISKYLAAEAFKYATERAVHTFGGYGLSSSNSIERFWRLSELMLLAPISQEMVLNFVSHNILGLPKSY